MSCQINSRSSHCLNLWNAVQSFHRCDCNQTLHMLKDFPCCGSFTVSVQYNYPLTPVLGSRFSRPYPTPIWVTSSPRGDWSHHTLTERFPTLVFLQSSSHSFFSLQHWWWIPSTSDQALAVLLDISVCCCCCLCSCVYPNMRNKEDFLPL